MGKDSKGMFLKNVPSFALKVKNTVPGVSYKTQVLNGNQVDSPVTVGNYATYKAQINALAQASGLLPFNDADYQGGGYYNVTILNHAIANGFQFIVIGALQVGAVVNLFVLATGTFDANYVINSVKCSYYGA